MYLLYEFEVYIQDCFSLHGAQCYQDLVMARWWRNEESSSIKVGLRNNDIKKMGSVITQSVI